jgi:chorismate mutase
MSRMTSVGELADEPSPPSVGDAIELADELITELRKQIDATDASMLQALAERMALVKQIGHHKKTAALATVQLDRWRQVLKDRVQLGRTLRLTESFVVALFEIIHTESINLQNELALPHPKVTSP